MAQQNINVGTSANDGTGDTLRDSQIKANGNFTELYTNKVDKISGKGLSSNDFTDLEQTKLADIEDGAEVNVQADFLQTDDTQDDYIKNKPPSLYASVGFFDYNDLNTQTSPLVLTADVPYKITNDTLGAFTNITNAPYGVSNIWDAINNTFDFSELSIGDTIDIRNDLQITTIGANENVKMFFRLAAGSPSEYDLYFYDKNFKSAGVNVIQDFTSIYIGSQDYIDFPTEFYIVGDSGGSVKVNGWYTRILLKDVNIVSFSDPTKKVKLESNKYNETILSGSDSLIPLQSDGSSYYELTNAGLVSVKGFDDSLILDTNPEYPYEGKDFVIKNSTGNSITLKENILIGTRFPFKLKGAVDAIMPTDSLIWFKSVNGITELEEIMRSWSDIENTNITIVDTLPIVDIELNKLYKLPDDSLQFYNGTDWVVVGSGGGGGDTYPKVIHYADQQLNSIPTHTGTTAETIGYTFTIPANTVPANCMLRFTVNIESNASGINKFIYFLLNGISPGLNAISSYFNLMNNGIFTRQTITYNYPVQNGLIYYSTQPNQTNDGIGVKASRTFNVTLANTINILFVLGSAADSLNIKVVTLEVLR